MHVIKYLKEHGISKLQEELSIKVRNYDNGLMVLNYHQLNSPSSHPIVKECRSLILDKDFNVVSRSFDRFFNLNEKPDSIFKEFSQDMDLYEKLDGSIINIYNYENLWNIGTKSAAFGEFSTINSNKTFKDLVIEALKLNDNEFQDKFNNLFNKNYTYICEFTGKENKVVKEYSSNKLNILAIRCNKTGNYIKEENLFNKLKTININKPKKYKLNSLEDINSNLKTLKGFDEGFVLYKNGCPVAKIKTLAYVTLSLMKGEHGFTKQNLAKIVISGESSEFITYFPEHKNVIEDFENKLKDIKSNLVLTWDLVRKINDKADFAKSIIAQKQNIKSVLFAAKKANVEDIVSYFENNIKTDLLVQLIIN